MADDSGQLPDGEEDLGPPIEELRGYEEAPSAGFLGRLLRSLRRRSLGSQLATLGWTGFGQVFLEFLKVIYSIFEPRNPDREEER